mmetsp:Transcript_22185/g.63615  ORF Transcript_22185/g.63615 Transcript_22185/m.63615 type:complete len:255 (+) Transcript_22185:100-864(+)
MGRRPSELAGHQDWSAARFAGTELGCPGGVDKLVTPRIAMFLQHALGWCEAHSCWTGCRSGVGRVLGRHLLVEGGATACEGRGLSARVHRDAKVPLGMYGCPFVRLGHAPLSWRLAGARPPCVDVGCCLRLRLVRRDHRACLGEHRRLDRARADVQPAVSQWVPRHRIAEHVVPRSCKAVSEAAAKEGSWQNRAVAGGRLLGVRHVAASQRYLLSYDRSHRPHLHGKHDAPRVGLNHIRPLLSTGVRECGTLRA